MAAAVSLADETQRGGVAAGGRETVESQLVLGCCVLTSPLMRDPGGTLERWLGDNAWQLTAKCV